MPPCPFSCQQHPPRPADADGTLPGQILVFPTNTCLCLNLLLNRPQQSPSQCLFQLSWMTPAPEFVPELTSLVDVPSALVLPIHQQTTDFQQLLGVWPSSLVCLVSISLIQFWFPVLYPEAFRGSTGPEPCCTVRVHFRGVVKMLI